MMRRGLLSMKVALRNVVRNRIRSLYAFATISIGAAGLFVFMGFNHGLMNQYRANTIHARWGHGRLTSTGYTGVAHTQPTQKWISLNDSLLANIRSLPGVLNVFPRVPIQATLIHDGQTIVGRGEGIDGVAEARFFDQLNYTSGANLGDDPRGIVVGQGLAAGLNARVGDEIRLAVQHPAGKVTSVQVKIAGVFHTGSQEFDSQAFRLPLVLAQRLLETDRVESISVGLSSENQWPEFARQLGRRYPALEAVPFDELDKVYYRHAVDWLDAQFAFIRGIIVLVVFLAIFNVISVTVAERTGEIGTLRANGESKWNVFSNYFLEAAMLGLIGGCLGIASALALVAGPLHPGIAMPPAPGITRSFRILIELAMNDAIEVVCVCLMTALVGSLLPVLRAIRIPIAEALRHA